MPEANTLISPDGIPGTNADAAAVFVNPGVNPAEANLWIRGESNGNSYQLTTLNNANFSTFGFGTVGSPHLNGWTFLPGGLYLQWGKKDNPTSSGQINLSDNTFAFPNAMLMAFGNYEGTSLSFVRTTVNSANQFGYSMSPSAGVAAGTLKWFAIGY